MSTAESSSVSHSEKEEELSAAIPILTSKTSHSKSGRSKTRPRSRAKKSKKLKKTKNMRKSKEDNLNDIKDNDIIMSEKITADKTPDDKEPDDNETDDKTSLKIYYDKMLGKGTFAKVFPGKYKDNIVAVKIITTKHLESNISLQLERELQVIRILQTNPHKNVASYYKIFQSDDKMIIVMELCSGGELTKHIKKGLEYTYVKDYFVQILDWN
jgi:hypothetical protein